MKPYTKKIIQKLDVIESRYAKIFDETGDPSFEFAAEVVDKCKDAVMEVDKE